MYVHVPRHTCVYRASYSPAHMGGLQGPGFRGQSLMKSSLAGNYCSHVANCHSRSTQLCSYTFDVVIFYGYDCRCCISDVLGHCVYSKVNGGN